MYKLRAEVEAKVKATIKEHGLIEKDMHIVLGLSGGPDSVCLFDVLYGMAKENRWTLHPVHVNHKFRPLAAERDQAYVEKLCAERGTPCRSFVYDCNKIAAENGLTSEEAGRKARYEAFTTVAEETALSIANESERSKAAGKDENVRQRIVIAVAQNANDQAETILFRLLRGSGIDGLAGIAYKRYEGAFAVVRPLLDVSRQEIEKYCKERELSPRTDHTNSEPIYTRNKIRLELLPMLAESFNPNIIRTVNRLGKNASCDKEFLYQEAEKAYKAMKCETEKEPASSSSGQQSEACESFVEIYTERLSVLHKALRIRIYHMILTEIGMRQNLTQGQLEAIDDVCFSESPSAMCELADGYRTAKLYDRLRFFRASNKAEGQRYSLTLMSTEEFADFKKQRAADAGGTNARSREANLFGAFALPEAAAGQVCVRNRRKGDTIAVRIRNAEGETEIKSKKLQDFFVDAKLPKLYRDEIELLAYGSRILWVLPSERFTDSRLKNKGRFSAAFSVADARSQEGKKLDCEPQTILVLEIL